MSNNRFNGKFVQVFTEMNVTRRIALQRIHILFRLAKETIHEDPKLAQRYVKVARKIAMATKLRLPKQYKRLVCRHCKSFILPGVNCRVRIQQRREPHVVVTCFCCDKYSRIPLRSRRNI
ncbi:MAG: ribonuclease P [Candidatus Bathyarchaeota archaeon]|nr:MAG: ribonuclease P [Candidatus Bathyarchaeota archaeon]